MQRILAALLALALAGAAAAANEPPAERSIAGASFDRRVVVDETPLVLHSLGKLTKWFLTGYAAGLYLGEGTGAERVLEDVPKRLELHYFYGVEAEKFGKAADTILARQFDERTLASVEDRIERIAGLYTDVEPGDRYALTYLPGRGTQLAKNGEIVGTIPGADFARVYFSIWLGEDPLDEDLRAQLLGPAAS